MSEGTRPRTSVRQTGTCGHRRPNDGPRSLRGGHLRIRHGTSSDGSGPSSDDGSGHVPPHVRPRRGHPRDGRGLGEGSRNVLDSSCSCGRLRKKEEGTG